MHGIQSWHGIRTKVFKLYESEEIRTEYDKYTKYLSKKKAHPKTYDYNKCVKESDLVQTSTTVKKRVYGLQEILDELDYGSIAAVLHILITTVTYV